MPKAERIPVEQHIEDEAIEGVLEMLRIRLREKGSGAYHSRHETYGIITEEYVELGNAVHRNDGENFEEELVDIAVACIHGVASHKVIYKHD